MNEEIETYTMNGITVESKFDSDEDRKKMKARVMQSHPLLRPPFWLPQNMTEFLFYSDNGQLVIHEEGVKALSYDFTTILKGVHEDLRVKYEDTVKVIIADTELNGLDFPLIVQPCSTDSLSKYLSKELAEKLKLQDHEQVDDK